MSTPPIPEIETVLVVRELPDGQCSVFPLADPSLVAFGARETCLDEQRLFLAEHLARARPEVVARFSHHPDVVLHEVGVVVPRADLPHRQQMTAPVPVAAAVIPRGRDRWVVLLPLAHTFYLAARDDLDEAVRRETLRVCLARNLDGDEYRDLLLASGTLSLERLRLAVATEERGATGAGGILRRRLAEARQRRDALEVLASVARPLHDAGAAELVGRAAEASQLAALLGGRERASVLLVGRDKVGKSSLLRDWIREQRAAQRQPLAFSTSAARLVAGMSGLGQWQERVRRVMAAAEAVDAIVCFEALAELFGDRPQGLVDLPGALKPWIEERRVRVVGEITPEALGQCEAGWAAFLGGFHRVALEPLSRAETAEALRRRARRLPGLAVAPEASAAVLDLAERYLPYDAWPGKGVRLLEEVAAARRLERGGQAGELALDARDVHEVFSGKTGVPLFLLRDDVPLLADTVERALHRSIVGQAQAVRLVTEAVVQVKAGLQPAGRPLASFLFLGPTGVGKTELARALAGFLFGSPDRLLRFDLSEYQDPLAAERLIRGRGRRDGVLTRAVRQQPFALLLLDEIEKAHPAVHDLLLQVLGEGRLTDARGRTAFFHDAVIVMTSNVGASHGQEPIGVRAAPRGPGHYERELLRVFRPEFLNRIGRVVPFAPLSRDEVREVTALAVARVARRRGLAENALALEVDERALLALGEAGYSPAYGARALRRQVETDLVAPLARLLAGSTAQATAGSRLRATAAAGTLQLTLEPPRERGNGGGSRLADVSTARREIDRWCALPAVEAVKDRIDFLVVQLAGTAKRKRKPAEQLQAARLQEELHRLQDAWDRLEAQRQEAHAIEEVALAAALDGQDASEVAAGMPAARTAVRRALLEVILAPWPRRDQISLLLTEVEPGALLLWLRPLVRERQRLGWTLTCHLDGGARDGRPDWPAGRRYGPPRDGERAVAELCEMAEAPATMILSAQGPRAGLLLVLEAGLHRFTGVRGDAREKLHFHCQPLAWRSPLPETAWAHGRFSTVPLREAREALRALPASRELTGSDKPPAGSHLWWLPVTHEAYWEQFEEIALEHLLAWAQIHGGDLDDVPAPPLPLEQEDAP